MKRNAFLQVVRFARMRNVLPCQTRFLVDIGRMEEKTPTREHQQTSNGMLRAAIDPQVFWLSEFPARFGDHSLSSRWRVRATRQADTWDTDPLKAMSWCHAQHRCDTPFRNRTSRSDEKRKSCEPPSSTEQNGALWNRSGQGVGRKWLRERSTSTDSKCLTWSSQSGKWNQFLQDVLRRFSDRQALVRRLFACLHDNWGARNIRIVLQ